MLRTITIFLLLCCLVFAAKPVRTDKGLVAGVPATDPSVTVYKGIPYAAPPVGDLRWRAPRPAAPWKGVLKADRFSKSCMQASASSLGPWTEEYMDQNERSEDCLYLNVWTAASQGKRPVLFWIHGGAFDQGSTSVALYDGEGLARKGVVVVTTNYRLGLFGFLAHPELTRESEARASGNYGILDLIAALKWVQANIGAFGGDPTRVTIAGQSAGSSAVHVLVASPLAKGLFHQAIAQSGSSASNRMRTLADAEADGVKLMTAKGAKTLKEMRDMPVYQVLAPVEVAVSRPGPVVDGWMLPETPGAIFAAGKQNDVVTMTGYTADEGSSDSRYGKRTPEEFQSEVRRAAGGASDLADEFLRLYPAATAGQAGVSQKASARDQNLVSMLLWARQRAVHAKTPVYAYLWTHPVPGPKKDVYGAHHSAELGYVFNSLSRAKRPFEPLDREIADRTSSYWANFVRTGNPNGAGLPEWPVFDVSNPQVMELGERFAPRPLADPAKVKLFEAVLSKPASPAGR
ncbi:MAG: carboxylesterase/lipase family protein [Bryobacteraceae bacterium]